MADRELIYKRADNRWEARYRKGISQNGKTVYGSVYGRTRKEAEEKRLRILGEAKEPARQLNLLILGAGSHGKNIFEIAESLGIFEKISFLDDHAEGDKIIGKCRDAVKFIHEYPCAFIAIGDNKKRMRFAKLLREQNFILPKIVSPAAHISRDAVIGEGSCVLPQATVNDSTVGEFCIVASNSLVSIDCKLGAYSHVDEGAVCPKKSRVPEGTWVKSGEIWGVER